MALTPEQIDLIANEYLVGVFQEMEQDVISDIARRVRKTGRLTETAELMAQSMANQGFSPAEIRVQVMQAINADPQLQAAIAKNTLEYKKKVAERIDQLVKEAQEAGDELVANAGRMCYNDDLSLWREAGKELNNTALPQIIAATQAQTQGMMRNLTQTTALAMRDASGVEIPIMDGYKRFLDKTTLEVATGAFSYDEAVNRTIKEMAKSGVRFVEYSSASGRKTMTELDVATRRAVRTGVSQMAGRIMEENVKNSDTDLVITSQHMGSRPEHAGWQNKVFSLTGKTKGYKTLADGTGYGTVTGLKGANCTHNFYPYWPGISVKEPDIKEPPPVKINGRTYTYYQATQKQREYERKLRAAKREIAIQEGSGGNPDDIAQLKRDTRALSKEYTSFSNAAGISPKPNRTRVVGVDRGRGGTPSVVKPKPIIPTKPKVDIKEFMNPYTGEVVTVEKSRFSQIRDVCGDEFVDKFVSHLDRCDELTQALFHRYGDRLRIIDKTHTGVAYYDPLSKGVLFDMNAIASGSKFRQPFQTALHEFGHMLDDILGPTGTTAGISKNDELYKLIKLDGREFVRLAYLDQGFASKPSWSAKTYLQKGAVNILGSNNVAVLSGVSDMLEPVTRISYPLRSGHGLDYWGTEVSGTRQEFVGSEFMAHVLEGNLAPDGYANALKTVFPNAHNMLMKILWEALS